MITFVDKFFEFLNIIFNSWPLLILILAIIFKKEISCFLGSDDLHVDIMGFKFSSKKLKNIVSAFEDQATSQLSIAENETQGIVDRLKHSLNSTQISILINIFSGSSEACVSSLGKHTEILHSLERIGLVKEVERFTLDYPKSETIKYKITEAGELLKNLALQTSICY